MMLKTFRSRFMFHGLYGFVSCILLGLVQMLTIPAYGQTSSICIPGLQQHTLANTSSADGLPRQYRVYMPPNTKQPMPVVYAFHGATNTPLAWPFQARLSQYATYAGVMIVAPVAQPTPRSNGKLAWYAGDRITTTPSDPLHHDDAAFISDLVAVIDAAPCTKDERYLMGYSSGAGMAMTLACLMGDQFAATGIVAAAAFDSSCRTTSARKPLLAIHNRQDQIVSFARSKLHVQKYAARNQCTTARKLYNRIWVPSERDQFYCPQGAEVIFHALNLANPQLGVAGHAWPTVSNSTENATQVIFEFFGLL